MRYWNSLNSKYGFNDGDSVPRDAAVARELYVTAINLTALALQSNCRLVAIDLCGVHNPMQVTYVPARALAPGPFRAYDLVVTSPPYCESVKIRKAHILPVEPDSAMSQAVQFCKEAHLDTYLETRVEISPNFELFFADIAKLIGTKRRRKK